MEMARPFSHLPADPVDVDDETKKSMLHLGIQYAESRRRSPSPLRADSSVDLWQKWQANCVQKKPISSLLDESIDSDVEQHMEMPRAPQLHTRLRMERDKKKPTRREDYFYKPKPLSQLPLPKR
jgi:hypothetical protein